MESKNAQGQIGRGTKLSRLPALKWMDVFCLSKENKTSIQQRRRSKREILSRWAWTLLWAGLVQHCPAPPKQFSAVPLLKSSFHTKPSLPLPPFPTVHWESHPSGCLLAPLPSSCLWDVRQQCHKEHLFRAFLSLLPAALSSGIVSGPHWNEGSWLSVSSSAQTSLCHQREVRSPSLSLNAQVKPHLRNLWDRSDKKSMGVPWHEGQPLFYCQRLLWKQLVLHELFAFQS